MYIFVYLLHGYYTPYTISVFVRVCVCAHGGVAETVGSQWPRPASSASEALPGFVCTAGTHILFYINNIMYIYSIIYIYIYNTICELPLLVSVEKRAAKESAGSRDRCPSTAAGKGMEGAGLCQCGVSCGPSLMRALLAADRLTFCVMEDS